MSYEKQGSCLDRCKGWNEDSAPYMHDVTGCFACIVFDGNII